MISLMVYGVVLATLLAAAAHFLDRGLRELGRPTRWIWALAMAGAGGIPIATALWKPESGTSGASRTIPIQALYEMMAGGIPEAWGSYVPTPTPGPPLLLLWIFGSGLILLTALWASRRLRRAARKWERRQLGSEEVLVSQGLGPAVLGLIRPVIVIPPWVLELSREKRELILLHEKEHRSARDPATLILGLLLAASAPWNPALWWMARRLHLAIEGDCDARVLAHGVHAKSYGDLLLEVASAGRGLSALAPALVEGRTTFLERRLLMIRSAVRQKRKLAAVTPVLVSAGLLVLACETPTPPGTADQELSVETSEMPAQVSEAEEGYFLVKKEKGKVEYIGPVSEGQLELIQEDPKEEAVVLSITESETGGGTVRIQGRETVGGDPDAPGPLIVVDGVIFSDPRGIEALDKENIESIEVIKGAAAQALYGERAEGGVIHITTKG